MAKKYQNIVFGLGGFDFTTEKKMLQILKLTTSGQASKQTMLVCTLEI